MGETVQNTVAKPGKRLKIALGLSLMLNLAVAGVVAGAFLRDGHGGREAMVRDLGFGPYSEALRPEDRKALRAKLFERAPELREQRRQMRADTQALLQVLRADPFDPTALDGLLAGQRDRLTSQLQLGQELLRDFLVGLPASERAGFADRLEGRLHHGGPEDRPAKE